MDNLTDKSKRSMIYPFHRSKTINYYYYHYYYYPFHREGWKTMSAHLIISWLVFKHFHFVIHNVELKDHDTMTGHPIILWMLFEYGLVDMSMTVFYPYFR